MGGPTRSDLAGTGFTVTYLAAMAAMLTGTTDGLPHGLVRPLILFLFLPIGIAGVAMIILGNRGARR